MNIALKSAALAGASSVASISIEPAADSNPDARLLALADEYVIAEQRWCDLDHLVDLMDTGTRRRPVPDILLWREEDAALGLPTNSEGNYWKHEAQIDKLRAEKWLRVDRTDGEDGEMTIRSYYQRPSSEARDRADQIIAAFDKWFKKPRKPRGFWRARREADEAYAEYVAIEKEIAATRAVTLQGMIAKIRCAKAYAKADDIDWVEGGSCAEVMAVSIFHDIEKMTRAA